jgi:hypothetical protein
LSCLRMKASVLITFNSLKSDMYSVIWHFRAQQEKFVHVSRLGYKIGVRRENTVFSQGPFPRFDNWCEMSKSDKDWKCFDSYVNCIFNFLCSTIVNWLSDSNMIEHVYVGQKLTKLPTS